VSGPFSAQGLLRGLAIAGFAAMLAYLLFGEHRVHLLGYLPFLFLLACPLLHMTMHGGHGGHGGPGDAGQPGSDDGEPTRQHPR
jgi:hypothetical protein